MNSKRNPTTPLRIACIWFPISAVGGIATAAWTYRAAARIRGDVWHILRCPLSPRATPEIYDTPRWVRGGDTSIRIDGTISHHPNRFSATKAFLEANYDALFFVHPCMHPVKAYGPIPYWQVMYTDVDLPKIMRVPDAHYETYTWVDDVLPFCKKVFVIQPAYAEAVKHMNAGYLPIGFIPPPELEVIQKLPTPWHIWGAQSKTVKGYPAFVKVLPKIDVPIGIFSSGVYYYNLRTSPEWQEGIGRDYFMEKRPGSEAYLRTLTGPKDHVYYGYVPPDQFRKALNRGWSSINLQGYTGGKRKAYQQGSFNNLEIEALWAGCRLVGHTNFLKSPIPNEFIQAVDTADELPRLLRDVQPLSPSELKRAREWVMATFDAKRWYGVIRKAILE